MIIAKFSSNPKIYYNSIKKNLDPETFVVDADGVLPEKSLDKLKKDILKNMTPSGLEIKRIYVNFRKLIGNLMLLDDGIREKDVRGKNVCVVDDYITTGTTLDCAMMELLKLEPNSLIGLTLLK
jgi:predicted phosphoribosyltransferase